MSKESKTKDAPADDLVEVTCAVEVFHAGKRHPIGTLLRVSMDEAKADCFKKSAKAQSDAEFESARAAAAAEEAKGFWSRVKDATEIRKRNELAQATAAQRQLELQAERAREATKNAQKAAGAG